MTGYTPVYGSGALTTSTLGLRDALFIHLDRAHDGIQMSHQEA